MIRIGGDVLAQENIENDPDHEVEIIKGQDQGAEKISMNARDQGPGPEKKKLGLDGVKHRCIGMSLLLDLNTLHLFSIRLCKVT